MSLFAKAQVIAAKPTGKAKTEKQEIALAGILAISEIDAQIKALTAVRATLDSEIKEAGFGEFLAMETKVRPESFKGIEGEATCSVEMRKRGTNSALNEDEVKVLEALGLTPFKQIITTQMFGINPIHAGNEALMEKVSKALEKIVPEDFIVLQAEASKQVVNDELLEAAFALPHGSDERKTALSLVTTMALKPKLNAEYDMSKLSANVDKILHPVEEEETVVESVAKIEAEGAAMVAEVKVRKARAKKEVTA